MKLQELDARRPTKQIAKALEGHYESRINFDRLSEHQTRRMLGRVRDLLAEHKSSVSRHFSERNPDYMRLVMLEQALRARMHEQRQGVGKQRSQKTRRIMEASEIQTAQVVLAAQDMVDRIQGMMEDISEMQFKDLPALVNSIRNDMGPDQATQFQAQASTALSNLLTSVQAGKAEMEAAQGVLTGQAPVVPGAAPGEMPAAAPAPGEEELDLSLDANLPGGGEEEEEEEEVSVGLGRERR